jgi:hypothetical protein
LQGFEYQSVITLQYYTLLRTHYYLIYQRLTNYSGTTTYRQKNIKVDLALLFYI